MKSGAIPLRLVFQAYFAPPSLPAPALLSVLYLLRRDAAQSFGYNPNTYDVRDDPRPSHYREKILWPGTMAVFAGIDLLGKFEASTDLEQQPAGTEHQTAWRFSSNLRFKTFVRRYVTADPNEVELVFQLRNALVHSFSLFGRQRRGTDTYNFVLDQRKGKKLLEWRQSNQQRDCIVYLYELHRRFERAVIDFMDVYENRLQFSQAERTTFVDLLSRYGFIGMGAPADFGW